MKLGVMAALFANRTLEGAVAFCAECGLQAIELLEPRPHALDEGCTGWEPIGPRLRCHEDCEQSDARDRFDIRLLKCDVEASNGARVHQAVHERGDVAHQLHVVVGLRQVRQEGIDGGHSVTPRRLASA